MRQLLALKPLNWVKGALIERSKEQLIVYLKELDYLLSQLVNY
jgi:hypothetical protein